MANLIQSDAESLREEILAGNNNDHKKLISSFCNALFSVKNDELFFVYRVVYTYPPQTLLYKIRNELYYIKNGASKEDADVWFNKYAAIFFNEYDVRYYGHAKVRELERSIRVCRFCGGSIPAVK